jgi:aminoglycoside phosphotransferase (APT) family kinase protein
VLRAPIPPDAGLPRLADALRRKIGRATSLSDAARAAALEQLTLLEQQPGGHSLCHGDFHPGNVVLSARGPVIIDWNDATLGPPAADVARTQMLFLHGGTPPLAGGAKQRLVQTLRRALFALPLHRYRAPIGIDEREVAAWRLPVATARMSEFVPTARWIRTRTPAA